MLMYGVHQFTLQEDGTPDPNYQSRYGGGVLAFITEGTLRSVGEISAPLNEYADMKEERCRRRKADTPTDWKFTVNDLWELGRSFGVPVPTAAEREAQHDADEQARVKREADAQAQATAYMKTPEYAAEQRRRTDHEFRQDIVFAVLEKIEPAYQPIQFANSEAPTDEEILKARSYTRDTIKDRRKIEPAVTKVVAITNWTVDEIVRLWKAASREYVELNEMFEGTLAAAQFDSKFPTEESFVLNKLEHIANGSVQSAILTPSGIPVVLAGTQRHIFTRQEWREKRDTTECLSFFDESNVCVFRKSSPDVWVIDVTSRDVLAVQLIAAQQKLADLETAAANTLKETGDDGGWDVFVDSQREVTTRLRELIGDGQ
jgi:hypothetical protein